MLRTLLLTVVALVATPTAMAAESPTPKPLDGVVVSLDPGHNPGNARHASRVNRMVQAGPIRKACDTTGAATRDGYPEWRFNQQLATRVARHLRAAGATIRFTRTARTPAWGPCITERARRGNQADVAVSLHADGNLARSARGFHIIRPAFVRGYTGDITRPSAALATELRNALVATGKLRPSTYIGRRGLIARRDLGGLVLSDVPKVFVEAGNLRHSADARLLRSRAGQERIARAISAGLVAWHVKRSAVAS